MQGQQFSQVIVELQSMDTVAKKNLNIYQICAFELPKNSFSLILALHNFFYITAVCIGLLSPSMVLAETPNTTSKPSTVSFFVEFKPGNYRQPINSSLDKLTTQLYSKYTQHQITLIGKSESKRTEATQQLAINRAKIIKKLLVKRGLRADRIFIQGEHINLKLEGDLQHGVTAIIKPLDQLKSTPPSALSRFGTSNSKLTKIGFVEFSAAEYKKVAPNEIQRLLNQLSQFSNTVEITILGISQSRQNLATNSLALKRAQTVADNLIAAGISSKRINLDSEITNLKSSYLIHGAYIFLHSDQDSINSTSETAGLQTEQQATNPRIKTISPTNQNQISQTSNNRTNNKPANIRPLKKAQSTVATEFCAVFDIKKGSLKTNIQREIADCGYLMGNWNFGTDDELIDWLIPIPYSVKVEKGIFGVLNIIEKNYQIRAHVHQLDKSIDFATSIKRDSR